MEHNTGLVLIHGAGLNASIWDDFLKETNIPALAIDFPNRKLMGNPNEKLKFDDYVSATVQQISHWNQPRFIIVAHSIGACIGLQIAEQFRNQLKGFVVIGSVIPKDGQSFASALPFPQKLILPLILRLAGTKPPDKAIENELCNDLSPQLTLKIVNEFTPEAKELYLNKIHYSPLQVKKLYIKLTNDKAMAPSLQDKMAMNLKADKTITIDSGHLPMLSRPKELAGIVVDFVKEIS